MPLAGKYLKYSPEITLEIFTLIWDKLSETYKPHSNGVEVEYNHAFKKNNGFLKLINNNSKFGVYYIKESLIETTVQEILGYDPFVKEDFVLPEKWFIRCTNESKRLLDKWTGFTFKYINIYYDDKSRKTHSDNIIPGYTEITFEQFQKYVLKTTEQPKVMEKDWSEATEEELLAEAKRRYPIGCTIKSAYDTSFNKTIDSDVFMIGFNEDVCYGSSSGMSIYSKEYNRWAEIISLPETKVENKEVIPEYVECIKTYTSGFPEIHRIFPVKNGIIAGICGYNSAFSKEYFKPSTKEAFEAQNKSKQQLKQAVHCKTQEEWYFVTEKLGYKWDRFTDWNIQKEKTFISLYSTEIGHIDVNSHNNQILSFQEWCDSNGYKMEKEVKFKVGQLVWISSKPMTGNGMDLDGRDDGVYRLMDLDSPESATGHLHENSHFKFKCGKFYYKTNIKNIRHATPEEINNYLISIGQITTIEGINKTQQLIKQLELDALSCTTKHPYYGVIENPYKDVYSRGQFRHDINDIKVPEPWKSKTILSIDDEELPMVNIIKTNSIKQLLNLE